METRLRSGKANQMEIFVLLQNDEMESNLIKRECRVRRWMRMKSMTMITRKRRKQIDMKSL